MMKSSRIRWAGHVAHKEVMMNKYDVIVGTTGSYKPLWNLTHVLCKRNDGRNAVHPEYLTVFEMYKKSHD